ncbi:hypothetical protein [Candidatus Albibeggiatoa sp. nov. NOAA]|uniref:hypothetical protein n=1 Tax=Candidatus Albibeggiatoa sp. nov. NOAA TaxID=3162724 RepID=UPI0032F0A8EB|nr:hypothetical protein [Thiotrichaceae bacterium]
MTETCSPSLSHLADDLGLESFAEYGTQHCNIDFQRLLAQGEEGLKELDKKIALYLQLPNEVDTCSKEFELSAPFPIPIHQGSVVYALEPTKAQRFIQARGHEIQKLIKEHLHDLKTLLDIIKRQNNSDAWHDELEACIQKIGIVSIGLEGSQTLEEEEKLIPETEGLTESEIKIIRVMRRLGLLVKVGTNVNIVLGFIVKELIYELVRHVFLTQYGQHYLVFNMSNEHIVYESHKMIEGKLSTFFKHSITSNNPQAVIPPPLKDKTGKTIGIYVGHIASRSEHYTLDILTPLFSTKGVVKFYPLTHFPQGVLLGWSVAKLPSLLMNSRILVSTNFKDSLEAFSEQVDDAVVQSSTSKSAQGGIITANIAPNADTKEGVMSYGIVCFE